MSKTGVRIVGTRSTAVLVVADAVQLHSRLSFASALAGGANSEARIGTHTRLTLAIWLSQGQHFPH